MMTRMLFAAMVVLVGTSFAGAATTEGTVGDDNPTLIYDPALGTLVVETTREGNGWAGLEVISAEGLFTQIANDPGNGAINAGAGELPNTIGWISFSNIFGDGHDLGSVLPTGLGDELFEDLSIRFSSETGGADGDLIVIPEPATAALMGIAGLAFLRRRQA